MKKIRRFLCFIMSFILMFGSMSLDLLASNPVEYSPNDRASEATIDVSEAGIEVAADKTSGSARVVCKATGAGTLLVKLLDDIDIESIEVLAEGSKQIAASEESEEHIITVTPRGGNTVLPDFFRLIVEFVPSGTNSTTVSLMSGAYTKEIHDVRNSTLADYEGYPDTHKVSLGNQNFIVYNKNAVVVGIAEIEEKGLMYVGDPEAVKAAAQTAGSTVKLNKTPSALLAMTEEQLANVSAIVLRKDLADTTNKLDVIIPTAGFTFNPDGSLDITTANLAFGKPTKGIIDAMKIHTQGAMTSNGWIDLNINGDNVKDASASVSPDGYFNADAGLVYVSFGLHAGFEFEYDFTTKGSGSQNTKIVNIPIPGFLGGSVAITFNESTDGAARIKGKTRFHVGYDLMLGYDFSDASNGPSYDYDTIIEFVKPVNPNQTVTTDFGWSIEAREGLGDIAYIGISANAGAKIKAKWDNSTYFDKNNKNNELITNGGVHYCNLESNGYCVTGDITERLKVDIVAGVDVWFYSDDWNFNVVTINKSTRNFLCNPNGFSYDTTCVNKGNLIDVTVLDSTGNPYPGVTVAPTSSTGNATKDSLATGTTDSNGKVKVYHNMPSDGSATYQASIGGTVLDTQTVKTEGFPIKLIMGNLEISNIDLKMPLPYKAGQELSTDTNGIIDSTSVYDNEEWESVTMTWKSDSDTVTNTSNWGTMYLEIELVLKDDELPVKFNQTEITSTLVNTDSEHSAGVQAIFDSADIVSTKKVIIKYQLTIEPTEVSEINFGFEVPKTIGASLPTKDAFSYTGKDSDGNAIPLNKLSISSVTWLTDALGFETPITSAVEDTQYAKIEIESAEPLKIADRLKVTVTNTDTSSSANKYYEIAYVKVADDGKSATIYVVVNITDETLYHLTVNEGFNSGWYKEGAHVLVLSYDIEQLKELIKDYIGSVAYWIIEHLIPSSWQHEFNKWQIDSGDVTYKGSFTPTPKLESGFTYAVAFLTMPAGDVEITAIYDEKKEVDEVYMDVDLPIPGKYMPSKADSDTEGVCGLFSSITGGFDPAWSGELDSNGKVKYNTKYTVAIPLTTESGYDFAWPLGTGTIGYITNMAYPNDSDEKYVRADCFASFDDYALLTHTYTTPKAQLLSFEQPKPIIFDNGTASSTINSFLSNNVLVKIKSEKGTEMAKVNWNKVSDISNSEEGRFTYKSSNPKSQMVYDSKNKVYELIGTLILPGDVRNEKTSTHEIVDQTVRIVIIIDGTNSEQFLYPPTADPDSCESNTALNVQLIDSPKNAVGQARKIYYTVTTDGVTGAKKAYSGAIALAQKAVDVEYRIDAYAESGDITSPVVSYYYTVKSSVTPETYYTVTVENGTITNKNGASAQFKAGETVKIKAKYNKNYESFVKWTSDAWQTDVTTEEYTFTMPAQNVTVKAVLDPKLKNTGLIESGELLIDIPAIGGALDTEVNAGTFEGKIKDSTGTITVFADGVISPLPAITWDDTTEPVAGNHRYTANIQLTAGNVSATGTDTIEQLLFSNGLKVKVNGMDAIVNVEPAQTKATVHVTFEIEKTQFTVNYDANGGSGAPEAQIKNKDVALTLSSTVPTRQGYRFVGWATSKESIYPEYNPGDIYEINEDVTLYAIWVKSYTILVNASEGGQVSPLAVMVDEHDNQEFVVEPLLAPGTVWYVKGIVLYKADDSTDEGIDITDQYENGVLTLYDITENYLVYVEFDFRPHTIKGNVVGGQGTISIDTKFTEHGQSEVYVITPSVGFHIDKVTAKYYRALPNPIIEDVTDQVVNGVLSFDSIKSNMTVEVVFERDKYEIRYHGNGGTSIPEKQYKTYGVECNLTTDIPVKDHYVFVGWQVVNGAADDASGKIYSPGELYTVDQPVDLYAIWTPGVYVTVTHSAGGNAKAEAGLIVKGGDAKIKITPALATDTVWRISKVTLVSGDTTSDITENVHNGFLVIENVQNDISVDVQFTATPHNLTVEIENSKGGTVTPMDGVIQHRGSATLTITANEGYKLGAVYTVKKGITKDVTSELEGDQLTLSDVTTDVLVKVVFVETPPEPNPDDPSTGDSNSCRNILKLMLLSMLVAMLAGADIVIRKKLSTK